MADADDHLNETVLRTEQLLRGGFLDVRKDTVRLPSGDTATREYIVHPGAVAVVPLLDDGRIVMERQYRCPLRRVFLEVPAGKIDPGEDHKACAIRELAEETGYRAAEWAKACVMHNAIAYSTEGIEIWFARGLTAGEHSRDHGEHIEILPMTQAQLEALAARGQLTDAKTLVALMWLARWRAGDWLLRWEPA
ncbi:MAG: NUDIX hydrolase [Pseudomonadota bacterium]